MSRTKLLAITLLIISATILLSIIIYGSIQYNGNLGTIKTIQGDCYDKYNNKINEVTCAVEVIDEYDLIMYIGLPVSIFMTIASWTLFLLALGRRE